MRGKEYEAGAFDGEPVDAYGIPLSVGHAPQTALGVWQYVHQLETPIEDRRRPASPFTHVCLLCADELYREHAIVAPTAWTKALMRQRMSTNAVKHLERRHPGVSYDSRRRSVGGGAKRDSIGGAGAVDASAGFSTPSVSPVAAPPAKRARTAAKKPQTAKKVSGVDVDSADQGLGIDQSSAPPLQASTPVAGLMPPRSSGRPTHGAGARSSADQILFLLHRWLISAGLEHEETQNEELQRLLAVASKTLTLELFAPGTFDMHLEMEFTQFARGVEQYLSREQTAACNRPFVSIQCDVRTGSGGADVLGLSLALVDSKWRHVVLPLAAQPLPVAAPNSGEHTHALSHRFVRKTLNETYKIDVNALGMYSSVNTDPAAARVKTRQQDDLIHAVSACLLQALGIVGSDALDSDPYSVRWLEYSLEMLLSYFQHPARSGKLYQIAEFFHAQPAALGEISAKTRLGYLHELFKRSCLNFATYSRYFATTASNAPPVSAEGVGIGSDDGERVWGHLAASDAWQTIVEIEAVLSQLTSQLELDTLHPRRVSSSYAHFFRRLLRVTLNAKSLKCLPLEDLSARSSSESEADSGTRESRSAELLTTATRAFLTRLGSEINVRFQQSPNSDEVKAMLLDPRIKGKVSSLVDNQKEVAQAEGELRREHRAVFLALAELEFAATGGDDKRGQQKSETSGTGALGGSDHGADDSDEDEMSALLAMDGPSKRSSVSQNPFGFAGRNGGSSKQGGGSSSSTTETEALARRRTELEQAEQQAWQRWQSLVVEWENFASRGDIFLKNGQYNVAKLYQRVDVLAWFRLSGAQLHPSVAVLARAYLARPAVASAAHDEFVASLGDWDAVGLHNPTYVRREARLRVLQHSWRQWKELAADEVYADRRGKSSKRTTVV